jgi:hypothetical protein
VIYDVCGTGGGMAVVTCDGLSIAVNEIHCF